MGTNTIELSRHDLKAVLETLDKFPNTDHVTLEKDSSSGIGYTLSVVIETTIEGVRGEFKVRVVDVDQW